MLNRTETAFKIVCLALAVLLLAKVAHRVIHPDPLGHAVIPPLPTLSTNSETATNQAVKVKVSGTNATVHSTNSAGTNALAHGTNSISNHPPAMMAGGMPMPRRGRRPRGFGGMMGGGPSVKLPANIQAWIDRIKESEILGPFMRPPPMALMGIADDDAFLRAPDGETGMVKEGGELGGVKVLRIGINRVLVEENGEKKELTLFDGAGSESLMPPETDDTTNAPGRKNSKETP